MQKVDYKDLKNQCFIKQVDEDRFSMRFRIAGGTLSSEHLKKVYELSEKFGEGYVHLTSRQSIEIPYIKLEDIEEVKLEMQKAGLRGGQCGPKVRTITACQGSVICPSGLIDTTILAKEFDELYYGVDVPHKFKIGITGCRNNCLKAEENDIGVKGGMKPTWDINKCKYCGACETKCPSKSIKVEKQDNRRLSYDLDSCIMCGRCVKACKFNAWEGQAGYVLYFGGLFGNKIQIAKQLLPIIFSKNKVHKVIVAVIEFFRIHGKAGERFGNCLNRIGWDVFEEYLRTNKF